ncbi:TPA: hypothetical protein DCZ46_01250 [Candidatus Campbellbacteria bacterium]|nr:MAG: seg [Candidatus Campbellbacteria bacterium GW2011_OD1_34_28]KKP75288.1 MAG: hypothetical protein UR74_C0001G0144 [Candidatus Campbellbacteria bacterium GW2011_GWD2_35_24]KKP76151.1 MAG: hypothetical protein UR75_C0001G0185 [Candidatus Campbellbacteria bacterium GW2011_GWC2_35_28]KKP77340.1 MAG: hypothetical protein UR76_C0001G0185 [Candidatus Campbellbacteria bacterium GW2011_GWC1_35_31]KKP79269.1 MAG: hypothetical protein UR79_C0001G0185 [Candidatus Campbellbacteria bacterium GW2011_GW
MTKKILIILIIILILAVVGVFIFYFAFSKNNPNSDQFDGSPLGFIFGNFGGGGNNLDEDVDNGPDITIGEEKPLLRLRKISETPTAGFVVFQNEDKEVTVRYTERSTGHIFEASTVRPTIKRISNTTIPRIYEAVWVNSEESVMRYLDEDNNIKSFYAKIIKNDADSTEEGKTEGVFLRDNIKDVFLYGKKILNIYNEAGYSQFVISDVDGSNSFEIYEYPLEGWLIQSPKTGMFALTIKPTYDNFGYLYFLDINSKEKTKILSKVVGLTTLTSGDANKVLFAEKIKLSSYDVDNKETKKMDVDTLPEKCAWFNDSISVICGIPKNTLGGKYPDDWYQGIYSFSDDIYILDVDGGFSELIISPEEFSGENIDLIKPIFSSDEKFLFFINKKDQSLWSLEISPEIKIKTENIETATTTSEN